MLVSIRHRLAILAQPKCASTALHRALERDMDVVVQNFPGAKHTSLRKFDRFLRPYLESFTDSPIETVCLFREPVDWLASWWRYRGRADIPQAANSTRSMDFARFCEAYLTGEKGPAKLGRQSRFVSRPDGSIGVDRIFAYEALDGFRGWLERRLDREIALDRVNVSPEAHAGTALSDALRQRLEAEMAADFHIHATALAAPEDGISGRALPSP